MMDLEFEELAYDKVINAEHRLESEKDKFLRDSGWVHTCQTPGAVWLWKKQYRDETILTSADLAIFMQLRWAP